MPAEDFQVAVNVKTAVKLESPSNFAQYAGTASNALQAAQPLLAAANLGVGLLNLGVSVWTAWKVHKMDKKLDDIVQGVTRLDGKVDAVGHLLSQSVLHLDQLIRGNALLLGVVIENQEHLGSCIALLREEVARGFRSVHEALNSAEARREAHELERQMRELHRYYELCTREMQAGREPPTPDLRRIVDTATTLISWLDTRIAALVVGRTERLPLLVARSFALRLEVDARDQLSEAPDGRLAEFEVLRGVIRGELAAITNGAPLCALAIERRELVEQYVYLSRALKRTATMVQFPDGSVTPFYPVKTLSWDDGLEGVRRAIMLTDERQAPDRLELRTLEEHHSVQHILGLPRGGTEEDVELAVVSRALGIPPNLNVSEDGLRELLRVGPQASTDVTSRINSEVR